MLSQLSGNFFSTGTLARNVWHQVVFVYNAAAQSARYYVDGALEGSASVSNAAAAFTSAYYLGQYDTGTYYKWDGRLAQEAFYLSALTAAQVAQHYSAAGY
ncbi:MAG TPA: LamG-like jellyroll fold domain-containing protein [Candidatus Baltobacteraceae bacterium]|nr:LamG-like jellyroll fold domain-containing protein [Candidatus Baltobacteraceae bacterium]